MNSRPGFLSIICILTFTGSAFFIYNSIISYSTAPARINIAKDVMEERMEDLSEEEKEKVEEIMGSFLDHLTERTIQNYSIASILASILTLIGAVLMWGLNKKGFYWYIGGTVLGIVAPLFIFGGMPGIFLACFMGIVGLVFCLMYKDHLKYMN